MRTLAAPSLALIALAGLVELPVQGGGAVERLEPCDVVRLVPDPVAIHAAAEVLCGGRGEPTEGGHVGPRVLADERELDAHAVLLHGLVDGAVIAAEVEAAASG